MSDNIASNSGETPGPNTKGVPTPGQRSEKNKMRKEAAIEATMKTWGVSEYADIFPSNIRPARELGDSAVLNLRYISRKVPVLAEAQLLMTNECLDKSGKPVTISFRHTNNILAHLKVVEAKAAEDKKNKDEEKLDKLTTESGSSESLASPKSLAVEKRLTASNSVAARKSAEAKAAEGSISAVETSSQASAPGKPSAPGETVVPAKALLSGKVTSLSKVKAPIPVTHLSQGGKQVSESGHASLMGGKSDDTEMVKLATVKKPSPKMRGSLPSNDNQSLYTNLNAKENRTSAKRRSDSAEEQPVKKLKLSKESLLAELDFVERGSQKDSSPATSQTPSEAETDIDIESVPKLLGDNVAIKYGFDEDGDKKAISKEGEQKPPRDAAAAGELAVDKSVNRPKRVMQVRQALAYDSGNIAPYACPSLTLSATKREAEKKRKAPGSYLESPASPKHSLDREENFDSEAGRNLSELQNSKRVKTTGSFSPTREVNTNSTPSPDYNTSNLSVKTHQESSIPKKDTMDYINKVSNKAEEPSTNAAKEGDTQLTPKASATPARGITFTISSAIPSKPNTTFPKLPETLNARIPGDRALILSIPAILKAYINELRASIPDGKGPDGDLLSMIIVNKYGYFLEHVDKLGSDLKSLYYEAIDKDLELEARGI